MNLVSVSPTVCSEVFYAYNAAHKSVAAGLSSSTLRKDSTTWNKWEAFCIWMFIPEDISYIKDLVPLHHIFAERVRTGVLAAEGNPI